jgi:hypothetical protein
MTENEENEAMAALNRLYVARLNEAMAVFSRFSKCVEGDFISHFNIFSMLQKPLTNLGWLSANKHAKILMQAVSGRFSRYPQGT